MLTCLRSTFASWSGPRAIQARKMMRYQWVAGLGCGDTLGSVWTGSGNAGSDAATEVRRVTWQCGVGLVHHPRLTPFYLPAYIAEVGFASSASTAVSSSNPNHGSSNSNSNNTSVEGDANALVAPQRPVMLVKYTQLTPFSFAMPTEHNIGGVVQHIVRFISAFPNARGPDAACKPRRNASVSSLHDVPPPPRFPSPRFAPVSQLSCDEFVWSTLATLVIPIETLEHFYTQVATCSEPYPVHQKKSKEVHGLGGYRSARSETPEKDDGAALGVMLGVPVVQTPVRVLWQHREHRIRRLLLDPVTAVDRGPKATRYSAIAKAFRAWRQLRLRRNYLRFQNVADTQPRPSCVDILVRVQGVHHLCQVWGLSAQVAELFLLLVAYVRFEVKSFHSQVGYSGLDAVRLVMYAIIRLGGTGSATFCGYSVPGRSITERRANTALLLLHASADLGANSISSVLAHYLTREGNYKKAVIQSARHALTYAYAASQQSFTKSDGELVRVASLRALAAKGARGK